MRDAERPSGEASQEDRHGEEADGGSGAKTGAADHEHAGASDYERNGGRSGVEPARTTSRNAAVSAPRECADATLPHLNRHRVGSPGLFAVPSAADPIADLVAQIDWVSVVVALVCVAIVCTWGWFFAQFFRGNSK